MAFILDLQHTEGCNAFQLFSGDSGEKPLDFNFVEFPVLVSEAQNLAEIWRIDVVGTPEKEFGCLVWAK